MRNLNENSRELISDRGGKVVSRKVINLMSLLVRWSVLMCVFA
jgi:hypothetical protein